MEYGPKLFLWDKFPCHKDDNIWMWLQRLSQWHNVLINKFAEKKYLYGKVYFMEYFDWYVFIKLFKLTKFYSACVHPWSCAWPECSPGSREGALWVQNWYWIQWLGVKQHCKALWVVSHTRKALYKHQLLLLLLYVLRQAVRQFDSMEIFWNSHFQILFHLCKLRVGKFTPWGRPYILCLFCLRRSMATMGFPKTMYGRQKWVNFSTLNSQRLCKICKWLCFKKKTKQT